jgi:hypothetical protein
MALSDFILRLLGLTETLGKWHQSLLTLGVERREKVARFAEEIAATLARAASALAHIERDPSNITAAREAIRELSRVAGYIDGLVSALEQHLDGRKLKGVKTRLDRLDVPDPVRLAVESPKSFRIAALLEAEGYLRALADGLRA